MNVLHVVAGDLRGGAARGAYWLHQAQRNLGIDSIILSNARDTYGDETIISVARTPYEKLKTLLLYQLGRIPEKIYSRRKKVIFNTGFEGIDITRHSTYKSADIIHLHWINGLVSMRTIRKIDKPIVWTMRDMWPFTGGCHYTMGCELYKTGCGQCPQLNSRHKWDLSRLIVANKRHSLLKRMSVIGISKWLSHCAEDSSVFNDFQIKTISNNVSTTDFSPVNKDMARQILKISPKKKIILLGAQGIGSFYKGFDLFLESMKVLNRDDVHVVAFGGVTGAELSQINVPYTSLGFLTDIVSMRLVYSAADVFVAPSRMDAFGKTLVESMACETPVVCFDATGPKDIVEHKVTGYKARPFSADDLAKGIEWVLDQSGKELMQLREKARERVVEQFDSAIIARQYQKLYRNILSSPSTS